MAVATPESEEVPEALQKLVRSVMRGFYTVEQCLVVDMLIHCTILREEELEERLQLEKKQIRQVLNSLKVDKLVRTRIRIETDHEGKTSRKNYYYIDYRLFVNVVKFKLDIMRRRLEADQRETTSRYSFRCPECQKTFTEMDVHHLHDQSTGSLLCTHCRQEVKEEEDKAGLADARALMLKYHEQVRGPVDEMLLDCDKLHLSTELQEPEFRTAATKGVEEPSRAPLRSCGGSGKTGMSFGASESSVTVCFGEEEEEEAGGRGNEQRPVWLRESTVESVSAESVTQITQQMAPGRAPGLNFAPTEDGSASKDEIMATLLLHEKRTARPSTVGRSRSQPSKAAAQAAAHASSSDGDDSDDSGQDSDEEGVPTSKRARDEMWGDGEEEEEEYVVTFKGKIIPYNSVTEPMIREMSAAEKEEYIEVGRRWYADNFE